MLSSEIGTLHVNETELRFVKFLHHGSGGLTSLYQDNSQNKFVLKSTLGEDATKEAEYNQRLNRLFWYEAGTKSWDNLLLNYVEGMDIDRFLAKHLDSPSMDELGCARFKQDYLQGPYASFATGLDRNITVAIKIVEAQETLFKLDFVHNDSQLANYVVNESEKGIAVSAIDFGAATDISLLNEERKQRIMRNNAADLIEALKSVLPRENHQKIAELLEDKKNLCYQKIIAVLREQLTPEKMMVEEKDDLRSKTFTPSFATKQSLKIAPAPTQEPLSRAESRALQKHQQFVQTRLTTSIKTGNLVQALCYLAHGGALDEMMVAYLKQNSDSLMTKALTPYIEAFEAKQNPVNTLANSLSKVAL